MSTPRYVLHVTANHDDQHRWLTYVATADRSNVEMTASVGSFAEAEQRADEQGYGLVVNATALEEMINRGVGPAGAV